jgi:hypothetical protein
MTSVIAALYTDRKMIVYEKDKDCVKAALDRLGEVAMKLTNSARAPLGKVAEGLYKKRAKTGKLNGRLPPDEESYEWTYSQILAHHAVLTDPNIAPASYTLDAACDYYGVSVRHVSDKIGRGLFATRDFEGAVHVLNIIGKFVR